jgi:hypothetical protein
MSSIINIYSEAFICVGYYHYIAHSERFLAFFISNNAVIPHEIELWCLQIFFSLYIVFISLYSSVATYDILQLYFQSFTAK